jgi:hypothetical protein
MCFGTGSRLRSKREDGLQERFADFAKELRNDQTDLKQKEKFRFRNEETKIKKASSGCYENHYGCGAPNFSKQITNILSAVPSPALELHRQHMEAQK